MTQVKNISVFAIGNPNSTNGVCPLVFYNNPQFDIPNSSEKGFLGNLYYFTVKIAKNYTVYQLTKNNVKSNNGNRGGFFALAFSIPKGYELVGTNPYRVLMDLWKEFRSKCMNLLDKNTDSYEFNSLYTDRQVLDSLAGSYILSPVDKPHREMNPSGPVGVVVAEENKIEELLSDVHYREFAQFQRVVIAETCDDPSNYILPRIQIPRPNMYSLYVDGNLQIKKYSNVSEEISVYSGPKDDPCYNHVTKTFTIKDLLNGDVIDGITVDKSAENIMVNTASWKTPKVRTISIKILPKEFENHIFLNPGILQLKSYDGRPILLDKNLSFKLTGPEINFLTGITVSLSENNTYDLASYSLTGNDIKVTLRKKPQIASQPVIVQGGHNSNVSVPIVANPQLNVVDVKLQFSPEFFRKVSANNDLYVKMRRKSAERKQMLFSSVVIFKRDKNNIFEGHIYIPKDIVLSPNEFYFEDKKTVYSLNKRIDANRNNNVFSDTDFSKEKKSSLILHAKEIVVSLMLLVSLILGGFGGYNFHVLINNGNGGGQEQSGENNDKGHQEDPNAQITDEFTTLAEEIGGILNSETLSFAMVNDCYSKYDKICERERVPDSLCQNNIKIKQIIDKLLKYKEVVDALADGQYSDVKSKMQEIYGEDPLTLISKNHKKQIDTVLTNQYSFKLFKESYNDTIKFKELEKFYVKTDLCDYCRQSFLDLTRHKNEKHHWLCVTCGLRFKKEGVLDAHINNKHTTNTNNPTTNTNNTTTEE